MKAENIVEGVRFIITTLACSVLAAGMALRVPATARRTPVDVVCYTSE